MPDPSPQPDGHDPGDPHDETCRCGLPRWRFSGAWWCATCDGRPRPDQLKTDPEAHPPGGPHSSPPSTGDQR